MFLSYTFLCFFALINNFHSCSSHLVLNHLGIDYDDIDTDSDELNPDYDEGEGDLLDQDMDEIMSNTMSDDYDRGCPGLDYLGVGYDSIYANSLGSDSSLLDPGYRAPIIEFTWRKNSEGYSPTLGSLHPVGGWVRPVFSCSRTTKINEINNLDELKDSLSASAKLNGDVPSNSFTGSVEYKNSFSNLRSKKQKIYNKTEQCIRYQVGIPLNLPWKFTDSFNNSVSKLPVLDSKKIRNCNIRDKMNFKNENCKPIKPWIKFFETFGTHFNHQLTLGGKITQTMGFDVSSLEELKKKGIDMDYEISSELGSGTASLSSNSKKNKSKLEDIGYKKMSVMGGQMPNFPLDDQQFAEWAKTVADNPMPTGVVATSLKTLLDPSLHSSYDEALRKYAFLNGISYEQLKTISGNLNDFSKEVENATTIVSFSKENKVNCPSGSKVLLGFSLIFGEDKLLGLNFCKSKTTECNVPTNQSVKYFYTWITCASGLQPGIEQFVKISNSNDKSIEVKCPNFTVIQMGFILVTRDGKVTVTKDCDYDKPFCKYNLNEGENAFIWAVCYSKQKNHKLQLKLSIFDSKPHSPVSCSKGYKIITGIFIFPQFPGFGSKFPGNDPTSSSDPQACEKYSDYCPFNFDKPGIVSIICKSTSV